MSQQIVVEALKLEPAERAKLIDLLSESLLGESEMRIEANWALESQRRLDDYKAGLEKTFSYSQVKRLQN